ncbi:hypothetical protein O3M35_001536 [Rhynocoris fuscipes]|uniref:Uncharacterized protein n=1 Tax=Rhynocoris fuscipes TaxID=488301 RepID=A0AAW1CVB6_9HEMI
MAPKKKCCCEKKKKDDCSQYPAGIQKEDLLWAYFVMRMVLDVMKDPNVVFRKKKKKGKKKKGKEPLMTSFDMAMMFGATTDAGIFQKNVDIARTKEFAMYEEKLRLKEEQDKLDEEALMRRIDEEERKMKEAAAGPPQES